MFNKVATKLSRLTTPFLNDVKSGVNAIGKSIEAGFANPSNNDAKVAKAIVNKSPFETKDTQQEALKRNPLGFTSIQYPLDLGNYDLGHYIIFLTISNRFGNQESNDLAAAEKYGFGFNSGGAPGTEGTIAKQIRKRQAENREFAKSKVSAQVLTKFPTHKTTTGAIALYMPPGVKVSYKNSYEAEATEMSGDIFKGGAAVKDADGLLNKLKAVGETGKIAGITYGKNLIGELINLAGAGDPVRLTSKALGVSINPQEEQFYVGPDFRSFSYTFDFYPRSNEELEAVRSIITLFKYHSAPSFTAKERGRLFKVPSEFEIMYMNSTGENEYLNKIGRVVCTGVDVDYGPDAQFSTFNNGAPVNYKMTVNFTETELVTKDKVLAGY